MWDGSGIISANAAADPSRAVGIARASDINATGSFFGESIDGNSILIRYTMNADANLDGVVNALDFNALASHFGQAAPLWSSGDFNYDGTVNTLDFTALAMNFNTVLPVSAAPVPGGLVPEPAAVALTAMALILTSSRAPRTRRR